MDSWGIYLRRRYVPGVRSEDSRRGGIIGRTVNRSGAPLCEASAKLGTPAYITARRVLGWASLVAGRYTDSRNHILKRANCCGIILSIAPASTGCLIDVFMYLADFKEARHRAQMALATFRKFDEKSDLAKTR